MKRLTTYLTTVVCVAACHTALAIQYYSTAIRLTPASLDGNALDTWDLANGICLTTYGPVREATVSTDGRTLAYSRGDASISITDARNGRVGRILSGFYSPPSSNSFSHLHRTLALSPNGRLLAAGAYTTDGFVDHSGVYRSRVYLWNVATGKLLRVWEKDQAETLLFSHDGKRLVELSPELDDSASEVRTRDVISGKTIADWHPGTRPFSRELWLAPAACDFTESGHPMIVVPTGMSSPYKIALWDGLTAKRRATLKGLTYGGSSGALFDIDLRHSHVVAFGKDGLRCWSTDTGKQISSATVKPAFSPDKVTLSPDGRRLAVFQRADKIVVIRVPSGHVIDRLALPANVANPTWVQTWFQFDKNNSLYAAVSNGVFVWREP